MRQANIKSRKIIIFYLLFLLFNFTSATIIESISLSTVKDTTLMILEVDSSTKVTFNNISKSNLKIIVNAATAIENLKAKGIIKKVDVISDSNQTTFNITFNKNFAYRKQLSRGNVAVKFFPVPAREIKTVILDAGHGGIDPGAVGKKKLEEKEVNLSIA